MFTGIVQATGQVRAIRSGRQSVELELAVPATIFKGVKLGDSVAVNGCCLTVVQNKAKRGGGLLQFDLLKETWLKTNLQFAREGFLVNLERPLRYNGTLDGHFVTGHIDDLGRITIWEPRGKDYLLEVETPADLGRYTVVKGSIAIDGISLTVAQLKGRRFRVWIIPHTYQTTALQERRVGDAVNLETDILGKYVERFVGRSKASSTGRF